MRNWEHGFKVDDLTGRVGLHVRGVVLELEAFAEEERAGSGVECWFVGGGFGESFNM